MQSVSESAHPARRWVDAVDAAGSDADIYSMLRICSGYRGPCRQLRRAGDNALLDVGFDLDGAYQLEVERHWAGADDVYLARWYNQSQQAGRSRPGWLEASRYGRAPRTWVDGAAVQLAGLPAIEMQAESWLASMPAIKLAARTTISVIWAGAASFDECNDIGLWSLHEEGIDDARTCEIDGRDHTLIRDRGIYYDRSALYSDPSADFAKATLIHTRCDRQAPYHCAAWINGKPSALRYQGAVTSIGIGTAHLLGPNRVHSFIVDTANNPQLRTLAIAPIPS